MTIINRALNKAYRRRSDAEPAPEIEQRSPAAGGWAPTLREPIRPIPSPDRTASRPEPAPIGSDESLAPPAKGVGRLLTPAAVPTTHSEGATVRFDAPHAPQAVPTPVPDKVPTQAARSAAARVADSPRRADFGLVVPADVAPADAAEDWSWPPIVEKLLNCPAGPELRLFAGRLKQLAVEKGLGCVALSGPGRSAGRTSLVLTLAHVLAEVQSARVVIVDADFGHPQAAQMLSLQPARGLWDAALEKQPATSALTTLIPEKLAIVPLVERVAAAAIDRRKIGMLQASLRALRRQYDIVLVDAGPWEALIPPLVFESRAIDAFVCVCRCDPADEERLDDDAYRHPGIEWLGMIETFTPASELKSHSVG